MERLGMDRLRKWFVPARIIQKGMSPKEKLTIKHGKKEKFEDNSVKMSILTTFGATKAQKRIKHVGSLLFG
jgi:hypothetical protein